MGADTGSVKRPEPGLYRHYKGKEYEVIAIGRHSETGEEMVVYKALYESEYPYGQIWLRPLSMFFESVETSDGAVPRFVKIS